jgi:hypothetical protein
MRRVFMPFLDCSCEDMGLKPTKRSMQSFVSHNGKDNFMIIENRFPADAKVVEITHNYMRAILYVVVESKEYPDVRAPTETIPVITTLDKKQEKVQFT